MKTILLLSSFLFAAAAARADVTIVQKVETQAFGKRDDGSPVINGTSVTKIKGGLMRIDDPAVRGVGKMSTIVDLAKGKSTTLVPAQKMVMRKDLASAEQRAQFFGQGKAVGKMSKAKPTGEKGRIGDWDAEAYEVNENGAKYKVWVAKHFPNAAALKEQLSGFSKAAVGPGLDLAQFGLPGVVVKTEMRSPQMNETITLMSVKEGPIAESEFTVTNGYETTALRDAPPAPDAGKLAKIELVMKAGDVITATTATGTVTITADEGLKRTYTWEGASRTSELWPRDERWYGSLGAYDPADGEPWAMHNGVTRGVVEEGQQHFDSEKKALEWLRNEAKAWPTVYRDDGIAVTFDKTLERRQIVVQVWQIFIGGAKPKKLPGSHNNAIRFARRKP